MKLFLLAYRLQVMTELYCYQYLLILITITTTSALLPYPSHPHPTRPYGAPTISQTPMIVDSPQPSVFLIPILQSCQENGITVKHVAQTMVRLRPRHSMTGYDSCQQH